MKSNYRYIVKAFMAMAVIAGTTSCDDFLDREPMSSISPETYYSTAAQLEANLNDEYPNVLPSFGQWTLFRSSGLMASSVKTKEPITR